MNRCRSLVLNCLLKRSLSSHSNNEKTLFSSSLYLSGREEAFSVVKPAFDKKYLTNVASNLDEIIENMSLRNIASTGFRIEEFRNMILMFAENSDKLKKMKNKQKQLIQKRKNEPNNEQIQSDIKQFHAELSSARLIFYALEDAVVPFLLKIPAPIDDSRCGQDLGELAGSHDRETAAKLGSVGHLRLGYFNNALQPSIVGPNAHYFTGEGAQTYHAIVDYLLEHFTKNNYQPLTGMDLVKSAIVEAVDSKPLSKDPFLLNDTDPEDCQRLHLAGEGSLPALIASIIGTILKPSKIIQTGSSYGDQLTQTHCVSATVIEQEDRITEAQEELYQLWWHVFESIGFRCRAYYAPLEQLKRNESSKLIVAVWLYSQHDWLPVLEMSNHSNYILRRTGFSDDSYHLLHSNLDMLPLIKCWLEHFQDPVTGRVSRPDVLKPYYLSL